MSLEEPRRTLYLSFNFSYDGGASWDDYAVEISFPFIPEKFRTSIRIQEIARKTLIAPIYGLEKGHIRYAAGVIKSTDGGSTWKYVGTIGYDPTLKEGYCEADIVQLANGDLLAIMRTGGELYKSRSSDGGSTWTTPSIVDRSIEWGVMPRLIRLKNNILLCSYGNRSRSDLFTRVMLMYSTDEGETWTQICVYAGSSCGYTWLQEIRPNTFRLTYTESAFLDRKHTAPLNSIRTVVGEVRKEESGSVSISFGEKVTLVENADHLNFPHLLETRSGRLFLSYSIGRHMVTERGVSCWSSDGGKTWNTGGHFPAIEMSDGTLVSMGFIFSFRSPVSTVVVIVVVVVVIVVALFSLLARAMLSSTLSPPLYPVISSLANFCEDLLQRLVMALEGLCQFLCV